MGNITTLDCNINTAKVEKETQKQGGNQPSLSLSLTHTGMLTHTHTHTHTKHGCLPIAAKPALVFKAILCSFFILSTSSKATPSCFSARAHLANPPKAAGWYSFMVGSVRIDEYNCVAIGTAKEQVGEGEGEEEEEEEVHTYTCPL
jgi:hypothetical protein